MHKHNDDPCFVAPAPELRDLSLDAEEPDGLAPNRRQPD